MRQPQGGGGAVRDLDGAVVGGHHRRDGPVAMRGEDPLDDRPGVRQIDPEPAGGSGYQAVFPLARDEHFEAEVASRLQVGVDPVAAGWGDQQDPGRALRRRFTGVSGSHRRAKRSGGPGPCPSREPCRIAGSASPGGAIARPRTAPGVRSGLGGRGQPQPPPAMPQAPQVPAPPVAWNTLLNTKVEPVSRVTKSISTPLR